MKQLNGMGGEREAWKRKKKKEKAPERMRNDLKVAFLLVLLFEAAHIDAIASLQWIGISGVANCNN